MSEPQPRPYGDIARKWLALVERRNAHIAELRESGRWKRYYTQQQLTDEIREIARVRDQWTKLAGLAPQADESSV